MSESRLKVSEQVQQSLGTWGEVARLHPEALAGLAEQVGAVIPDDMSVHVYGAEEKAKMPGAQGRAQRLAPEIYPVDPGVLKVNADIPPTTEGIREALARSMFDRYDLNSGLRKHLRRWWLIGTVGYSATAVTGVAAATASSWAEGDNTGQVLGVATLAIAGLTKLARDRFWGSRTMPDVSQAPAPVEIT